jgi:antitoxin MazE
MKITRTPTGWKVEVPDDVVRTLGLGDGDEVEVKRLMPMEKALTPEERERAVRAIRSLRGRLPADFKFDREEANARS